MLAYYIGASSIIVLLAFTAAGSIADWTETAFESMHARWSSGNSRLTGGSTERLPRAISRNLWLCVFHIMCVMTAWAAWSAGLLFAYEDVSLQTRHAVQVGGLAVLAAGSAVARALRRA